MLYLKMQGNKIMDHAWFQDAEYTEGVKRKPEQIFSIPDECYKYDYDPSTEAWTELTPVEIEAHPFKIKNKLNLKLYNLKELEKEKFSYNELKKDNDLSQDEQDMIDELILEIDDKKDKEKLK